MTKNIILCHPDLNGNPVAEVFGDVPSSLMALINDDDDTNRYQKAYPAHIGTFIIGFRPGRRIRRVMKTPTERAQDLAYEILKMANALEPTSPRIDPDWAVAVEIAIDRMNNILSSNDVRKLDELTIWDLYDRCHVTHYKEVSEYPDELDGRNDAFLEYLTFYHGFAWEFQGWDQESRLIANGLVRVPGTKIVQDLEGTYTISPRCHYCGQKTGWCRCSDDLNEIMGWAASKHLCNEHYFFNEFEEALLEYLDGKGVSEGMLKDLPEMALDMCPDHDGGEIVEIEFENDEDAVEFLVARYKGESVLEIMEWYEFIAQNWSRWVEWQEQKLEDVDCDDSFCECPLGAGA